MEKDKGKKLYVVIESLPTSPIIAVLNDPLRAESIVDRHDGLELVEVFLNQVPNFLE